MSIFGIIFGVLKIITTIIFGVLWIIGTLIYELITGKKRKQYKKLHDETFKK